MVLQQICLQRRPRRPFQIVQHPQETSTTPIHLPEHFIFGLRLRLQPASMEEPTSLEAALAELAILRSTIADAE